MSITSTIINGRAASYDNVDAAYIFDGLRTLRERARTETNCFTFEGAGELEDFGYMHERAIELAVAIEETVSPDEFKRLGVFAYEMLTPEGKLLQLAFERKDDRAAQIIKDWCAMSAIETRSTTP